MSRKVSQLLLYLEMPGKRKRAEASSKGWKSRKKKAEFKEKQLQRKAEKQLSKKAEAGLPKKAKAGKVFVTRSVGKKLATQSSSSGSNTDTQNDCVVCLGKYEEDLSTDGVLLREWVQCTSDMCKKWMHESCVPKDDDDYIVCICNNVFKQLIRIMMYLVLYSCITTWVNV